MSLTAPGHRWVSQQQPVLTKLFHVSTGAFSPGVPTSFLSNYRAAMGFLDQLEGMCSTKAAFQVCPQSPKAWLAASQTTDVSF